MADEKVPEEPDAYAELVAKFGKPFMGTPEEAPGIEKYLIKRGKVRNVYQVPATADDE